MISSSPAVKRDMRRLPWPLRLVIGAVSLGLWLLLFPAIIIEHYLKRRKKNANVET